jgi:ATP-dependent 26S proteasome regulatory subunit
VIEKISDRIANHEKIKSPVYIWTLADGMQSVEFDPDSGISYSEVKGYNSDRSDPILYALDFIEQHKERGIFVLIDLHPYLGSDPHRLDLAVVRKLKSLCFRLKSTYKRIILLGQGIRLADDLSGLIYELLAELPNAQEIRDSLSQCFEDLKNNGFSVDFSTEDIERLVRSAQGLTNEELLDGLRLATIENEGKLTVLACNSIYQLKVEKLLKLNLELSPPPMIEIGGLQPLKAWINKRTKLFNAAIIQNEIPKPKGLLLVGLPGTGKSLVAKTFGRLWNVPILKLDIGSLMNSLVGESEANMRQLLKTAEAVAPCILLIDEIEKAFASTTTGISTDSGVSQRMFGTFLTWMADKTAPVFVVATANDISALPPELTRKGRFDEIFFVDLPNVAERIEILKLHLNKYKVELSEQDVETLAIASSEFSGAELEAAISEAAIKTFDEDRYPEIKRLDVEEAIAQTVPLAISYQSKVEALRNWANTSARRASCQEEIKAATKGSRKVRMINHDLN